MISQNTDPGFADYLDHPALKKYIKRFPQNHTLFRQGDLGSTMFIILDGTVWLTAEKDGEEHVALVIEKGQFLGEKAVMAENATHHRFFSARTKSHVIALELGLDDIRKIQEHTPALSIDMLRRMFLVAAERLDRSNHMVKILRSSDNIERLVHLIHYFSASSGRVVNNAIEFVLSRDAIHYHIDMEKDQIEKCLKALLDAKILTQVLGDHYLLKNEKSLLDSAPLLRSAITQHKEAPPSSSSWASRLFRTG